LTESCASFDEQAASFDSRTGLSQSVAARIANTVLELGDLADAARMLEIGAGTGEIGVHLAAGVSEYLGIDSSDAMLDRFRARLEAVTGAKLLCADANTTWPVDGGSVGLIFGSRVFHLLDAERVALEVLRVADPRAAVFLSGRVEREDDSVRARMRRRMRQLLTDHGFSPRPANRLRGNLLKTLATHGTVLEPVIASSWQQGSRPADSVRNWMSKASMGGMVPPAAVKAAIGDELLVWARHEFGDPEREIVSTERYILEGVRLSTGKQ